MKDGRDEIGRSPQATHQHMDSHDSPVLSEKMYCTWPSSSFRLDVRANAGVSDSALYIERSLLIKRVACGSQHAPESFTNAAISLDTELVKRASASVSASMLHSGRRRCREPRHLL